MRRLIPVLFFLAAICLGALPASAQKAPTPLDNAAAELARNGFTGMVLAARGDRILLEQAFGPGVQTSQTFRFASVTKHMTAIMVMQEVEAGKLRLDAALGGYWPDFPNPQARAVTIRQLLMHYSGLASDAPAFHMQDANSGDDMQAFATGICAAPLKNPPGLEFDYNNCDYMVLGALLEKIERQPFRRLLAQRIFTPAGMQTAGYYSAALPDDPTHLHGQLGGQREPAVNLASYGAAGSAFGTLRDLFAFDRAFIKGKFLPARARAEMVKANATGGALGVWAYPFRPAPGQPALAIVERQGWIAGLRILNLVDLQNEQVVIIVSTDGDLDLTQTWAGKGPGAGILRGLLETR